MTRRGATWRGAARRSAGMDACEASRVGRAHPCRWPYTEGSGCAETYAESVGAPYDALSFSLLAVNAVYVVILTRRALHGLLDSGTLTSARLRRWFGVQRRAGRKAGLTSFDKVYLLASTYTVVQTPLFLDLHGWRGIYNVRAYRSALHVAVFLGFITGTSLVATYTMLSHAMSAEVLAPGSVERMKRSFSVRVLRSFILIQYVCGVVVQPSFFVERDPAVEDMWIRAPPLTLAMLIVVVQMTYCSHSHYRILAYLHESERAGHAPSKAKAAEQQRIDRHRKSIMRNLQALAAGLCFAILIVLIGATRLPRYYEERHVALETPCGLKSLLQPPHIVLTMLNATVQVLGPTRRQAGEASWRTRFRMNTSLWSKKRRKGSSIAPSPDKKTAASQRSTRKSERSSVTPITVDETGMSGEYKGVPASPSLNLETVTSDRYEGDTEPLRAARQSTPLYLETVVSFRDERDTEPLRAPSQPRRA